jgi:large subunit ribosomal protein L17
MLANLCCSLIENGRIKTTLARARALRPTIEKIITLAKKAHFAQDTAKKVHFRRLAISRLRSTSATRKLFDELVEQFANREGGYTRIYKLAIPRLGDASEMAMIEFVEGTKNKNKKSKVKKANKKSVSVKEKTDEISKENDLAESTPDTTAVTADPSIEDAQKAEPFLEDKPEDFEIADNSTIVEAVEQTEEEKESANQGQEEVEDADLKDSK